MGKIIISDTSCLIALTKIEQLDLLRGLYREIIITNEVFYEFGDLLPEWIIKVEVKDKQKLQELEKILDKGVASSIALALESDTSTLIIDEIKGRKIAQSLNIEIIGTIGVILLAAKKELVKDVTGIIIKLVNNGFRLSDDLINLIIQTFGKK